MDEQGKEELMRMAYELWHAMEGAKKAGYPKSKIAEALDGLHEAAIRYARPFIEAEQKAAQR